MIKCVSSIRCATGLLALLAAATISTGCTTTVVGTARRAQASVGPAVQETSLDSVLPTEQEISAAAGNQLNLNGFPPQQGGLELLPDGIRSNADASPIECVGATAALMRINYEHRPVRAAATVEFWNYDFNVAATSANVGAVRLAMADDARALFTTFTDQWRDCLGRTVVGHTHDFDDTELYSRIEDVDVSGPVLSATVIGSDNHHTPEFPNERAIGVKSNVIVEVDVAVTKPGSQAESRAINVVELMLAKIPDVG
jgi:hypothetical protein